MRIHDGRSRRPSPALRNRMDNERAQRAKRRRADRGKDCILPKQVFLRSAIASNAPSKEEKKGDSLYCRIDRAFCTQLTYYSV